jgi:hypothetical protein
MWKLGQTNAITAPGSAKFWIVSTTLDQSSFLEKFMVLDLPWSVFKESSSRCLLIHSLAALAQ